VEKLNFCRRSGYLVGPGYTVPGDPVEFYLGEERDVVSCTRLICVSCKEAVRVERDPLPQGQDFRTYACACKAHHQYKGLRSADDDDEADPWLPWKCSGHPIATLPYNLDGVEIAPATDLHALVRRTLGGWSPDSARPEERESPLGWVIKLYARLIGTGFDQEVTLAWISTVAERPNIGALGATMLTFGAAGRSTTGRRRADRASRRR